MASIPAPSIFKQAWLPTLLCFLILPCASARPAVAQATQTQPQQASNILSNPVLMTRMYYLFLSYQHHLDVVAAQFEASGKDASGLRNALQKQLRFSNADYKPVRDSAERLATEVQALNAEVKSNPSEMPGFSETRDQDVQAEMNTLANSLSPQNKAALDAFVVRLFSPRQPNQKAVQQ